MEWGQMAVFLWVAAVTHFLSDLSAFLKRRGKIFFVLHCILYALPFIPLFWWMKIDYLWLLFISGSHLVIDTQGSRIHGLVRKMLSHEEIPLCRTVGLGLDQVFHLLTLLVVALLGG